MVLNTPTWRVYKQNLVFSVIVILVPKPSYFEGLLFLMSFSVKRETLRVYRGFNFENFESEEEHITALRLSPEWYKM